MALAIEELNNTELNAGPRTLSEEEIEDLLNQAETRLLVKAGLASTEDDENLLSLSGDAAQSSVQRVRLPKLEHNLENSSYLQTQNGVTRTDSSLTIPAEQRKMANGLRPILIEEKNKKVVCRNVSSCTCIHMRKFNPKFLLMHISTSF